MFIERKVNQSSHVVELWKCEWENREGRAPHKVYLEKVGDEHPLKQNATDSMTAAPAICWSYGRTLGNIAVFNKSILGQFPAKTGNDALLPCDFVYAGKFRHGADRWWCRTHQSHWGTKADYESFERSKTMICANHEQLMNYVVAPFEINMGSYAEVGIWCSMPAALSTVIIPSRPPKIHVHLRPQAGGKKSVDGDFPAIALLYNEKLGLFDNSEITQVNVTPPAAFEFVRALEEQRELDCINCSHCGYPHLDLGDFAIRPHRKHFCANCGRDSTWSTEPIVSTPLKLIHDHFAKAWKFAVPDRTLNLDEYSGCDYTIWASTPAILWTAMRPQETGIHVHVHDGKQRVVDDTYSEVVLGGVPLSRKELLQQMMARTII
jgi:hypothetical protein